MFKYIVIGFLIFMAQGTNGTNSSNTSNISNITSNLSYYEQILPYFSPIESFIIDATYVNFALLDMSLYNLSNCTGSVINSTTVMACFYMKYSYLLTDYIIDFPNPTHYFIKLYVNPCKNHIEDDCKQAANESFFTDNDNIKAIQDLLLAWFMNNYILECGNDFQDLETCGTFFEIHRPFDKQIIQQVRLSDYDITGFEFTYISTKKLCAGKYEIWLVFRTRIGNILQYVKPFFVSFPSCGCDVIGSIITGYQC